MSQGRHANEDGFKTFLEGGKSKGDEGSQADLQVKATEEFKKKKKKKKRNTKKNILEEF